MDCWPETNPAKLVSSGRSMSMSFSQDMDDEYVKLRRRISMEMMRVATDWSIGLVIGRFLAQCRHDGPRSFIEVIESTETWRFKEHSRRIKQWSLMGLALVLGIILHFTNANR